MTSHDVAELSEHELDIAVAAGRRPLIIDVYAPWCAPCRAGAPMFARVARENAEAANFVKVNLDACPQLADKWAIRSLPTVLVVRGADVVWRANDLRASTLAQAVSQARQDAAPLATPLPFQGSLDVRRRALDQLAAAVPQPGEQALDRKGAGRRWLSLASRAGGLWRGEHETLELPDLVTDLIKDASATTWDDSRFATLALETLKRLPSVGISAAAMQSLHATLVSDDRFGLLRFLAPNQELAALLSGINRAVAAPADTAAIAAMHELRRELAELPDIDEEHRLLLSAAIDAYAGTTPVRLADFARRLRRGWILCGVGDFQVRPEYAVATAEHQTLAPRILAELMAGAAEIDKRPGASDKERAEQKRVLNDALQERYIPSGSPIALMLADVERAIFLLREEQVRTHCAWLEGAVFD